MADKKITQLATGVPTYTDILPYVANPGSAPATQSATAQDLLGLGGGWLTQNYGGNTWVYLSATQMAIGNIDFTAYFPVGTKIRYTQSGAYKYGYVTSTSFSGGNFFLNITGGSDYSIANVAITGVMYSYASNPQGFPSAFNYIPVWTGLTVTGSPIYSGRFSINGRILKMLSIINKNGGTVAGTVITTHCTIPLTEAYRDIAFMGETNINTWQTGLISGSALYPPTFTNAGTGAFIYFSASYEI